jgi:hypothetical protein
VSLAVSVKVFRNVRNEKLVRFWRAEMPALSPRWSRPNHGERPSSPTGTSRRASAWVCLGLESGCPPLFLMRRLSESGFSALQPSLVIKSLQAVRARRRSSR